MEKYLTLDIDATVSTVDTLVKKAEKALEPRLRDVNNILVSVKEGLSNGVDTISTSQAKEWLIALSLMAFDLTPQREAFELTSSLWKLETEKLTAQRLQNRGEKKKVDIIDENVILLNDYGIHQAVVDYMSKMLKEAKENIRQLLQAIRRIVDARAEEGDV